jgi:hypothetical protein
VVCGVIMGSGLGARSAADRSRGKLGRLEPQGTSQNRCTEQMLTQ